MSTEASGGTAAGGGAKKEESLPPGFRFHPTDEELITYYLKQKLADGSFTARAIAEVDLSKCEPWDLPEKAKLGEKEWYFFSLRDRKYPTGVRTNRATNAGYWKTTGKDKEIYTTGQQLPPAATPPELVGMKKTLVFYKGRAPRGEKTNWVVHEYRVHSSNKLASRSANKDEWVVCRVFAKSAGAVKKYNAHSGRSHHHQHPYTLVDPFALRHHPYMTPADLAELARFARGTPGLHPHIQPHPPGGYINLGASPAMPSPHPPALHAMATTSMAMSHHLQAPPPSQVMGSEQQQMALGLGGCVTMAGPADGGFAGTDGVRNQNLDLEQLVEGYRAAAGYQV